MSKRTLGIDERLAELEKLVSGLAAENAAFKSRIEGLESQVKELLPGPDTRSQPEELSSLEIVKIKELARDVQRYGYDVAMGMHGRKTFPRGRRKP